MKQIEQNVPTLRYVNRQKKLILTQTNKTALLYNISNVFAEISRPCYGFCGETAHRVGVLCVYQFVHSV